MRQLIRFFDSKAVSLAAIALLVVQVVHGVGTIDGQFKSITASGPNLVALDFNNDIYTSDDGGGTFTLRQDTSSLFGETDENFTELEALGATVIAVGIDGLTLRSTDDGETWAQASSPTVLGSLFGLAARTRSSSPNEWISVGGDDSAGVILRSTDDGQNWTEAATIDDISLQDAIWTGNRWLVAGMDEFFFEGVVYASEDGTNWDASTVPTATDPLHAMATDGNGVVLAVGERGQVLRSTDDGVSFSAIATEFSDGLDFNAVIADSSGTFFVGGDEKIILQIDGTNATTLVPNAETAPPVLDFVLIDDVATATGSFPTAAARTIPFSVSIAPGGSRDLLLSIEESLIGKSYFIETTTDLIANDWTLVSGPAINGTGANITFEVSQDVPKRFWRVVEF